MKGMSFPFEKTHLINSASFENVEAFPGAALVEGKITLHECPSITSCDTLNFLRVWGGGYIKKCDCLKDLVVDINTVLKCVLKNRGRKS
jgi:hypothetical protein